MASLKVVILQDKSKWKPSGKTRYCLILLDL